MLLISATILHLMSDMHKKTKNAIVHWVSATITVSASVVLGFANAAFTDMAWFQFAIFSLSIHFCFFDLIWNWANKKRWNYHGEETNPKRAWMDKFWAYIGINPLIEIFLRLIVLLLGIMVYYYNSLSAS
jgi:hypothetical protein